ncbi:MULTISPECIES: LysE family transporter [unclassified Clostridium]|uniref:LysE family translocator n=1 Tax=unclassified Clostridium TaxID=2614128 RepID=UPI0002976B41|nr:MULTISPECIES: LysE family transporter [unclassified Clostridium]EKQ56117.1 MAG: putative threonine efflux protein [Clostridium sp. Maddingley MBC34-26]
MIFKGFKFGMLLQFAIGPVCLFIFQMAALNGFYTGEISVLGVALVDGIFITIAILGVASIIDKKNIKVCLKMFGSIILFIFGFGAILNQFNIEIIPSLSIQGIFISTNALTSAIIITSSNPLTIIFWAGIFSTKITEENIKRQDVYSFGFGALLSTIFFLSLINLIGSFTKIFLPTSVIQILNIFVGFLLICFGIKMILKKV